MGNWLLVIDQAVPTHDHLPTTSDQRNGSSGEG